MKNRPLLVIASVFVVLFLLIGACAVGFGASRLLERLPVASISNSITDTVENVLSMPAANTASQDSSDPLAVDEALENDAEPAPEDQPEATATPEISREELFEPFWQAWDLAHEQFVDQPVDEVAMMRGAIKGMFEALGDPHTSYLDPVQFEESNSHLEGDEYEGIGAWVDVTGDYLTIISPMPDSPAEEAGLKPGDQVIAVDGEDVTGIDGLAVRDRVVGPRGTQVVLTIQREGLEEPFDVTVTRANIIVPSVESKMLENDIAYVHLLVFGDDTTKDLREAIKELEKNNPKGIILDLRYNGGGYRDTAIEVSSEFIKDGVIMYQEFGDGTRDTYESNGKGLATDIPMIVLINEGSASASEIVAGAIQDRERGQLLGTQSYGKGTVQVYTPLIDEQGAVRITVARWLTPSGGTVAGVGLTPDVIVEITDEDVEQDRDPQLDKAIEILSGK